MSAIIALYTNILLLSYHPGFAILFNNYKHYHWLFGMVQHVESSTAVASKGSGDPQGSLKGFQQKTHP